MKKTMPLIIALVVIIGLPVTIVKILHLNSMSLEGI